MLYNTGKSIENIPFEETRWHVGHLKEFGHPDNQKILLKLPVQEVRDFNPMFTGDVFGRISHIPICMMSAKDANQLQNMNQGQTKSSTMIGNCTSRGFERLLGYVDFEIASADGFISLLPQPMNDGVRRVNRGETGPGA